MPSFSPLGSILVVRVPQTSAFSFTAISFTLVQTETRLCVFSLTWVALMKNHHTTGGVSVAFLTGSLYKSDNIYSSVFLSSFHSCRALKLSISAHPLERRKTYLSGCALVTYERSTMHQTLWLQDLARDSKSVLRSSPTSSDCGQEELGYKLFTSSHTSRRAGYQYETRGGYQVCGSVLNFSISPLLGRNSSHGSWILFAFS